MATQVSFWKNAGAITVNIKSRAPKLHVEMSGLQTNESLDTLRSLMAELDRVLSLPMTGTTAEEVRAEDDRIQAANQAVKNEAWRIVDAMNADAKLSAQFSN